MEEAKRRKYKAAKSAYKAPEIAIKRFTQTEAITTSDIGGTEEIVVDTELGG